VSDVYWLASAEHPTTVICAVMAVKKNSVESRHLLYDGSITFVMVYLIFWREAIAEDRTIHSNWIEICCVASQL